MLVPEPIVYEDFLPRSAAGIFASNLTDEGTRDDDLAGTPYDIDTLSEVIGRPIADPTLLYEAQQSASLAAAARQLGLAEITTSRHVENALMSTDPTTAEITADVVRALKATGVDTDAVAGDGDQAEVRTPITGEVIFSVRSHTETTSTRRSARRPRGSTPGGRCRHRCAASSSSAGVSC